MLYDECDHELLSKYKWHINPGGYVLAYSKGRPILMHRLITDTPKGLVTDHKNRVKHDNRRSNLRICTSAQNAINRKNNLSTKHQGISKVTSNGMFVAQIRGNGKTINLGKFDSEEDAMRAYDSAAFFYFGEFAFLNFPDEAPKEFIEPIPRARVKKGPIVEADLSPILREKYLLKKRLCYGMISDAARNLGKPSSYIASWFSLDRPDKQDEQYKRALNDVIKKREQDLKDALAA